MIFMALALVILGIFVMAIMQTCTKKKVSTPIQVQDDSGCSQLVCLKNTYYST